MSFAATVPPGPTIPASGNFSDINLGMGIINMNGSNIVDLADPVNDKDAANKEYVDLVGGITGTPFSVAYYDSLGKISSVSGVSSDGVNDLTSLGTITTSILDATTDNAVNTNVNDTLTVGSLTNVDLFQGPKLIGTDSIGSSQGTSVCITDDYAIVGGPNENSGIGAVWIYKKTNNIWSQVTKIVPVDNIGSCAFGFSVSIVNDLTTCTAIIGGYIDNGQVGAAWIYQDNGLGWSEITKIVPNDNVGVSDIGWSVSITYDSNIYTAVIGGQIDNGGIGAAWIYQSTIGGGGGWTKIIKIVPSDNIGGCGFGYSVSIINYLNTCTAVIGGYADNSGVGAAWIYQSTSGGGSGWAEIEKIVPSNNIGVATFGNSVSITHVLNLYSIAVGGYLDNSGEGAAWIYQSVGGGSGWTEVIKLTQPGSGNFGRSVSIFENVLVIGQFTVNNFTGSAWLYTYSGNWTETKKILPFDLTQLSYFGDSVFTNGTNIIIGASSYLINGAAWIYSYGSDILTIANGNITIPGVITAGVISDGYGTYIGGGSVLTEDITTNKLILEPSSFGTVSTNFTTSFSFICRQGIITLTNITMATGDVQSQIVTNILVTVNSAILVSMLEVAGTGNCFIANISAVLNGSYDLNICNVGPAVAGVTLKITFLILN